MYKYILNMYKTLLPYFVAGTLTGRDTKPLVVGTPVFFRGRPPATTAPPLPGPPSPTIYPLMAMASSPPTAMTDLIQAWAMAMVLWAMVIATLAMVIAI